MSDVDGIAVVLTTSILRADGRMIDAMALDAVAAKAKPGELEASLQDASRSEARAGAFGMEIAGAIIVPVLIEAAKLFWKSYSEKLLQEAGKEAATRTASAFKSWFVGTDREKQAEVTDQLADAIRAVGSERELASSDIEALIAATTPEKLAEAMTQA